LLAECAGRVYTQDITLVLISIRDGVNPRAIVQLEGLGQLLIPKMTPLGIESAIFWLVTQCLNQLCYCKLHAI